MTRIALVLVLTFALVQSFGLITFAQEPAAKPPAPAATTTQPKEETPKQKSYLVWMIESSGPVGAVLFMMSFLTVALAARAMMQLRRSVVVPPELIAEFDQRLNEKKYQEAYNLANESTSMLGKVLAAGLRRVSGGYAEAVEAMQQVGEDESMRLEHSISYLAILGTAAPLLGLLGTVEGIIASFRVIATSDTQPKPSLLAEGISTSLFNTFEGLFVAIIAMVAFMLLKNRMQRLVLEVGMASENLMFRFKNVTHPQKPS